MTEKEMGWKEKIMGWDANTSTSFDQRMQKLQMNMAEREFQLNVDTLGFQRMQALSEMKPEDIAKGQILSEWWKSSGQIGKMQRKLHGKMLEVKVKVKK